VGGAEVSTAPVLEGDWREVAIDLPATLAQPRGDEPLDVEIELEGPATVFHHWVVAH
jgi:hypothetical protein